MVDTTYFLKPNESIPDYNARINTYNASKTAAPTASPSIGSLYGGLSQYDQGLSSQTDYYKSIADTPVDEAAIREATLKRFQGEIDATNSIYADKLRQATQQGKSRLAQTSAIDARRGLLGSDFAAGHTNETTNANNDVYGAINDEKAAALAAIYQQADAASQSDIKAKTDARAAGADKYIEYLKAGSDRASARTTDAAKAALAYGVDLTNDTDSLKTIANKYQISPDALLSTFRDAKAASDAAKAEEERKVQAATDDHQRLLDTETNDSATRQLNEKKFEEDKRQFGLNYAVQQAQLAISRQNAATENYKAHQSDRESAATISTSALGSQQPYSKLTATQKGYADGSNNLVNALQDYKAAYQKAVDNSGGAYFGQAAAELASKQAALVYQYSVAAGSGAVQKADADQIAKIIPNPTTIGGVFGSAIKGGKAGGVKSLDGQIEKFTKQLKNLGLQPTDLNGTGNVDPLGIL